MASGYVQCMNYAEGLHFSAFHCESIDCIDYVTRIGNVIIARCYAVGKIYMQLKM